MALNGKGISMGITMMQLRGNSNYENTTVDDFTKYLFERYPQIKDKQFQIAVNEEFVKSDDIVHQDDTVALIPPVSGG